MALTQERLLITVGRSRSHRTAWSVRNQVTLGTRQVHKTRQRMLSAVKIKSYKHVSNTSVHSDEFLRVITLQGRGA